MGDGGLLMGDFCAAPDTDMETEASACLNIF